MLSHATLGTNDLEKAAEFYDALLPPLGAQRLFGNERGVFYGNGKVELAVMTPFDGAPAGVGNGSMVTLSTADPALVDSTHARAVELGGRCEGAPGPRGPEGQFHAAYFRDRDGNKLCIINMG